MEHYEVEVNGLKSNFTQILNLAKNLLAKNEVLKAKLKEQDTIYNWNLTEFEKTISDLRQKNSMLLRKLNITEEDEPQVVSRDYNDVVKDTIVFNEKGNEPFDEEEEEAYIMQKQAAQGNQNARPRSNNLKRELSPSEEEYSQSDKSITDDEKLPSEGSYSPDSNKSV